jgi:hypothetical protein
MSHHGARIIMSNNKSMTPLSKPSLNPSFVDDLPHIHHHHFPSYLREEAFSTLEDVMFVIACMCVSLSVCMCV